MQNLRQTLLQKYVHKNEYSPRSRRTTCFCPENIFKYPESKFGRMK